MNTLQILDKTITTHEVEGIIWFKGKDVADLLGYANISDALAKHVNVKDKTKVTVTTCNRDYLCVFVNANGVKTLVHKSKTGYLEEAMNLLALVGNRDNVIVIRDELVALKTIEQVLSITLVRQYNVGSYNLDGYCIETNTAYEIDEPQHFTNGELNQECVDRQQYIEDKLGCRFVRIKV